MKQVLFGEGFDATSELANSSLIGSTLFSVISLTAWIAFLERLG